MKTGILVHVHHLEVFGWEELVWGRPEKDELGTMTKFVDCLLDISAAEPVVSVVYGGWSEKDGLTEGSYTKKYLVDRLDELESFPRLKTKLENLSPEERQVFVDRVKAMKLGRTNCNTIAEVENSAALFAKEGVDRVLQITPVTHAPRCAKTQSVVREKGMIPKNQQWFLVITDVGFGGATAESVVIYEPPHRGDDPVLGIRPTLPEILTAYQYQLTPESRKVALPKIGQAVFDTLVEQTSAENAAKTS